MTLAEIGQDIKKRQHLWEMEAQAFPVITNVGWSLCYLQLKQTVPLAQERRIQFIDRIHKQVCETWMTNCGCLSSVNLSAGQMVQTPFRLKKKSLKQPPHAFSWMKVISWTKVISWLSAQKCAGCWPVDKGPCLWKLLIQKPNVCDVSSRVCGKMGMSPPWVGRANALLLNS